MSTTAAEQLYPSMNAEELAKEQSNLEKIIEYKPIEGTPFNIAYKEPLYYLIMGKWKLTEGYETQEALEKYIETNQWNLIMKVSSCICYDFMKPLATIQGIHNAGGKVNLDNSNGKVDKYLKEREKDPTIGTYENWITKQ